MSPFNGRFDSMALRNGGKVLNEERSRDLNFISECDIQKKKDTNAILSDKMNSIQLYTTDIVDKGVIMRRKSRICESKIECKLTVSKSDTSVVHEENNDLEISLIHEGRYITLL